MYCVTKVSQRAGKQFFTRISEPFASYEAAFKERSKYSNKLKISIISDEYYPQVFDAEIGKQIRVPFLVTTLDGNYYMTDTIK